MDKKCFENFFILALVFFFMFVAGALLTEHLKDLAVIMNDKTIDKPLIVWAQTIFIAIITTIGWTALWVFFRKIEKHSVDCMLKNKGEK